MIPFIDLKAQYQSIKHEIDPAIASVVEDGGFILGSTVGMFEKQFADYCGARHCVGVNSGTDALIMVLRALDIGEGDEVILPTNTFTATGMAVLAVGATPVFSGVGENTYQMVTEHVRMQITKKTKAIIGVHLYGDPCDVKGLSDLCAARPGLHFIEDAAQAHGLTCVGRYSDAAAYSFYPAKNLGCYGDGGAVVTDNPILAESIRLQRNYGQRTKNEHVMPGLNSRLDALQAAVLSVKLKHLDDWNHARSTVAGWYDGQLQEFAKAGKLRLPRLPVVGESERVWHLYVVCFKTAPMRDGVIAAFNKEDIGWGIHYPTPLHSQDAYRDREVMGWRDEYGCANSNEEGKRILSLPFYPELKQVDVEQVYDILKSVIS